MMVKNMSAMNYALDYVSGSIKQFKMKWLVNSNWIKVSNNF
jgi:hypothetical protein